MNQEQARRKLPDLATGELDTFTASLVRREIERSPALKREWQEISALYADLYQKSSVPVTQPAPNWSAAPPAAEDHPDLPSRDDWASYPFRLSRLVLPTIAVASLFFLSFLPQSGWLIRQELAAIFGSGVLALGKSAGVANHDTQLQTAVTRNPDDFPIQLGAAMMTLSTSEAALSEGYPGNVASALQSLLPKFAGQPALYALLLDTMPEDRIKLIPPSEEEEAFPHSNKPPAKQSVNDPVLVKRYLDYAIAGEKADPANMYFTLYRAYLLFALDREQEGFQAIQEAGSKPRYNDYYAFENEAKWAAVTAANGETGVISRTAIWASTLYPSYARLRALGRRVVAHAIAQEKQGNLKEGIALRRAVQNYGWTMESTCSTYIGNLVGTSISVVATIQPGGAPALNMKQFQRPGMSTDTANQRMNDERLRQFVAYTTRQGHPEMARVAKQVLDWREESKRFFADVQRADDFGIGIPGLRLYVFTLGASYLSLLSLFWTILFGAVAFLLARTGPIRRCESLPPAVVWGLALLPLPALLLVGLVMLDNIGVFLIPLSLALIGLFLYLCSQLKTAPISSENYRRGTEPRRNLRLALLTVGGVYGLECLALVVMFGPLTFVQQIGPSLGMGTGPQPNVMGNLGISLILGGISMTIPAIALLILAIVSWKKGLPAAVGMVRGFRHIALPMASLMLMIYGGIAWAATTQDARLREYLLERNQNEQAQYRKMANSMVKR